MDHSSGQPVRIDGDNEQDVVAKVLRYRLDNHFEPGDPLTELRASICEAYPHFCYDTSPSEPVPPSNRSTPLSRRIAAWIAAFYQKPPASVLQPEANRRAAVCARCPHNRDFQQGGCGSCLVAIDRLSFVWRRGRTTEQDAELKGCNVLGEHLPTSVWAELPASQDPSLPAGCWRK